MKTEIIPLFSEYPTLEDDALLLRPPVPEDAAALADLIKDPAVYRYLPTFLYEQKYDDPAEMLRRLRAECFDSKESILLCVCLREEPERALGIAEIYNYEPEKEKASVGYRLSPSCWGRGIATRVTALLVGYLFGRTDVRKITAHVMTENAASGRVLEKNGFQKKWTGLREDWGRGGPVTINKYILKKTAETNP